MIKIRKKLVLAFSVVGRRSQRMNSLPATENVFKHVGENAISTCFSWFGMAADDFNRRMGLQSLRSSE